MKRAHGAARVMVRLVAMGAAFVQAAAVAAPGDTTRVSLSTGGAQGNNVSGFPSISADGRYVAFHSYASNLVPGDTNADDDLFVRDLQNGTTECVSVSSSGAQGNSNSRFASISADGRYVAFHSDASNLVAGDTNGLYDIFVHDRLSGVTERISVSSGGAQAAANSEYPSVSADGRYVAFHSYASNLVAVDTNGAGDVFVRDRQSGLTERISVSSGGAQGNANSTAIFPAYISADGRYVAFYSYASNLVAGDTNGRADVFVRDRLTGVTERVSVSSGGAQGGSDSGNPSISSDGRFVVFKSAASNLVVGDTNDRSDVFVRDRLTGVTERVSVSSGGGQGNGDIVMVIPALLSADGRYVTFASEASNLVAGDQNAMPDVFVHDRHNDITERVSVSSGGTEGNSESYAASISADGRYVAFDSQASNLVAGDTNATSDVFVRERAAPELPQFTLTLKPAVVAGCKSVTGTLTLSAPAPASGAVIAISDTLASASTPATVTVAAGATSRTFTIKTAPVAVGENGKVSATLDGKSLSQDLTIRPMGLISLTLSPTTVVGGQPSTGTAKLECKAGPGPVIVDLSSNNPAAANPVAADIVVPQGLLSATFDIATNAVFAKATATISGTANGLMKWQVLTVTPAASVSPTSLKFGSVPVGQTSATLLATLANRGAFAFVVSGISLTGTSAAWFAQTSNCPASLAAGASCTVSVTFTPLTTGSKSAKLNIATNATATPLSVSLSGTGL